MSISPKTIMSSDGLHSLNHTFFEPSGPYKDQLPIATLLIVHGMVEHGGRYADFAEYLANNGFCVLTYDQLGHGSSINKAEDLGFFNQKYPVQTLLKDVVIMGDTLKNKYPDIPHFIMGHSMGSFIVRTLLQNHSSEFTGAILMGTGEYQPLIKPLIPMLKTLNRFNPHYKNHILASLTNKLFNSKLKDKTSSSEFAWIVKNKDSLAKYEADPLTGFDFTNNGYYALFSLIEMGLNKDWAETIDKDFPMLFVSGEEDPVGDMGKGVRKVLKRLKKQGYTHIDSKLYPNMRHEPLHETEKDLVYKDIMHWLAITSDS